MITHIKEQFNRTIFALQTSFDILLEGYNKQSTFNTTFHIEVKKLVTEAIIPHLKEEQFESVVEALNKEEVTQKMFLLFMQELNHTKEELITLKFNK